MESLNRGDEASAQFYLRQLPPEQMEYVWSLVAAATGRPIESLRKPWWRRNLKLLFGVTLMVGAILYFIL